MKFGYFTLSDNNYRNNDRSPNQCVADILEQALYAEELGMHSVWVGEHHFSTLGVNSSPEVLLAYIAAKTRRVRLAPAVNVLPLHNPVLVAEQWATLDLVSGGRVDFATGRGYDRREYEPLGAEFRQQRGDLRRGRGDRAPAVERARADHATRAGTTPSRTSTSRRRRCSSRSRSTSRRSRSRRSSWPRGWASASWWRRGRRAPCTAASPRRREVYREACAAVGRKPGRLITSYFIHFADTPAEDRAARERQLRYHQECTSPAFPGDPKTAPENYRYFETIVSRYQTMKPEDFTDSAVLIGSSAQIADTLKAKVEAAGFDEMILYFNLGLKPHAQVKDEMARFMAEVAPEVRTMSFNLQVRSILALIPAQAGDRRLPFFQDWRPRFRGERAEEAFQLFSFFARAALPLAERGPIGSGWNGPSRLSR